MFIRYSVPAICIVFLFFLLFSCHYFNDQNFAVEGFQPADEIIDPAAVDSIHIRFSSLPNQPLVESSFSLSADGLPVPGLFSWTGMQMSFYPYTGFKPGTDYEVKLTSAAEDIDGHSLEYDFVRKFTTRLEHQRPEVDSILPGQESAVDILRPDIRISFSEPMLPGSVADAFRLSPFAEGLLTWDSSLTHFYYTLLEDLVWQEEYTISVSVKACDLQNNSIGEMWTSTFFTGSESVKPELLSLTNISGSITALIDNINDEEWTVTPNWETNDSFVFQFSEKMNPDSVQNSFVFQPAINWSESWNEQGDTLTLHMDSPLVWGETYTLTVNENLQDVQGNSLNEEYRYNLRVDGNKTKPPEIVAAVLYTDFTDAQQGIILAPYGGVSLNNFSPPPESITTGNTVIDIFFNLAEDTTPDLLSLMENFVVNGQGVVSFIPLAVDLENPDFLPPNITSPFGIKEPGVTYNSWVRFIVFIDNDDSFSTGILTFTVSSAFTDANGNFMIEDWSMPVQITD